MSTKSDWSTQSGSNKPTQCPVSRRKIILNRSDQCAGCAFNCRHLGHQVLPRSWLHWLSCPEHGASSCASVWSSAGGDQRVVQSPTCSPASASPSPSFGDAFLAAVWCLSSSAVSYHPPPVPLSMCLRSGLWESSGTTSNLHCECVRHPVASDVQNHVCFSTAVSKRASL